MKQFLLVLGWVASCAAGNLVAQTTRPASQPSLSQYETFAMRNLGNPDRGKVLFNDRQKTACFQCHSVETAVQDEKVGQPLFAIGDKFGRSDLVESILKPSATIAVGYSTTTVRLKSGDVVQGVVRESNNDSIALRQTDGKLLRIAAKDLASQQTSDQSLMPEGIQNALTLQEFADVIEYMASLKLPESAAALGNGMPSTIQELEKPIGLVPYLKNTFEHPVWFGPVPGMPELFAVEEHESGRIYLVKHTSSMEEKYLFLETGRFLTATRGLVGLCFHPDYAKNGRYFYLKHLVTNGKFTAVLNEGKADESRLKDSGQPSKVILTVEMSSNVHYGGGLVFGPDGYFYFGVGDTGPQGDPHGNAQNMNVIMGKMLRIDVDHVEPGKPYSIPSDNPFVGKPGARPEIWAYGLRTPWRFSFDPLNNDLWEGEVGQDLFEEVNIVRRGENYGWNVIEGFAPFSNKYKRDGEKLIAPIFAYSRKYGASSTGGFVYRKDPKSSFYGVYVFGDYQSSRIFGLTQENGVLKKVRQLILSPQHAVSFGRDNEGNLYLVGYEGTIYRIDLDQTTFK